MKEIHYALYSAKLHCIKRLPTFRPQPGCHLPNSPRAGIVKLNPPRGILVSDIPAGDGNVANLFLRCSVSNSEEIYDSIVIAPVQLRGIRVRWEVRISPSKPTGVESNSCLI